MMMDINQPNSNVAAVTNNNNVVEDDLQRILKSAGIESAKMDAPSMMALREMIAERQQEEDNKCSNNTSMEETNKNQLRSQQPLKETIGLYKTVHPSSWRSSSRGGLTLSPAVSTSNQEETTNTNTTVASSATGNVEPELSADPPTDPIVSQLQYQTSIMLQLQQQIQALHYKVDYLERRQHRHPGFATAAIGSSPNSASSDGERSFNMTSTKIYLRPSMSSEAAAQEEEYYDQCLATSSSSVSPQNYSQTQQLQTGSRKFTTRRFVNASRKTENDNHKDTAMEDDTPSETGPPTVTGPPTPQNRAAVRPMVGPQQLQQEQPWMVAVVKLLLLPFRAIFAYWRFEYQVLQALFRMGRQEIRPMDGGMLMQLFFVLLVVAKSGGSAGTDPLKQRMMLTIVTLGFLYHMKVLTFLYHFFVQRNVPLRIWKGMDPQGTEDVYGMRNVAAAAANHPVAAGNAPAAGADAGNANAAAAAAVPPRPPVPPGRLVNAENGPINNQRNVGPNANAAVVANINRWDEMFVMGGIAAPEHPAGGDEEDVDDAGQPRLRRRENIIVRLVWDIIYLFGSFLLSILPMWKPEQRPAPPPTPPAPPTQEEEEAVVDVREDQNNQQLVENVVGENENVNANFDPTIPLPHVTPPMEDTMEPVDEENDDDDNDEKNNDNGNVANNEHDDNRNDA